MPREVFGTLGEEKCLGKELGKTPEKFKICQNLPNGQA